eukprot:TRINITY_DN2988_c0_g2_i10.p1 TRINITY_DN2988_c0_g2~~TRINITY_DN2988_c0_g2_i10.p1  ORF type:complete len:108 (-),score=20.70 TRINITY_DN2988_c0_g2_i10:195-518(-)
MQGKAIFRLVSCHQNSKRTVTSDVLWQGKVKGPVSQEEVVDQSQIFFSQELPVKINDLNVWTILPDNRSTNLPAGAIAGIVIGSVLAGLIVITACVLLLHRPAQDYV